MPQSRTPSPARDTKNGSTSAASKSGKDQMAVKPEADTGKSPTTTSPTKTKFATPVATDSTNDNLVKMDTSSPTRKKKVIFTSSSDSESDEGSSKKQKQVSTDDNEKDDEESRTKKSKKKRSREDEDDEELNQDEREEDEEQGGDDDEQDDDEEDDDMDEDDEDDEEGSDEEGGPRKKVMLLLFCLFRFMVTLSSESFLTVFAKLSTLYRDVKTKLVLLVSWILRPMLMMKMKTTMKRTIMKKV